MSLLRGVAFEWYSHYETRTGCPGDWTTLQQAMLERFGSLICAEKAHAALLQLTQDKLTVLQYADAFESYLAQLEDYDESFYLTKFIFGLHPTILKDVFVQRPTTLLEAKRIAEELELTHSMVEKHQKSSKKTTTKAAQHRGTQKRRSGGRHQAKTYSTEQRQRKTSEAQYSGCRSAHSGALVASYPERHGSAAVWRSILRDLPQGDRAGRMRRQSSIVMVNLEALAHGKEKTSANAIEPKMYTHLSSGGDRKSVV